MKKIDDIDGSVFFLPEKTISRESANRNEKDEVGKNKEVEKKDMKEWISTQRRVQRHSVI